MANVNFFSPDGGTTRYPIEDTEARSRIAGQQSLLKDTVGWTGKNKLDITLEKLQSVNTSGTWNDNVYTYRNTTFTFNSNKTVSIKTLSGGASGLINFDLTGLISSSGDVIFSQNASGSNTTFKSFITAQDGSGDIANTGTDSSVAFNTNKEYKIRTIVYSGATVDTTLYPMLRDADIIDPTYEPYHESVEEEIEQIYADNGVLGAKNLLKNAGSTITQNGITATYNSDGSILLNGTATANVGLVVSKDVSNNNFLPNGKYILSGSAVFSDNCYLWINKYVSGSGSSLVQLRTIGEIEFAIDTSQYDGIKVGITVRNGTTLSNFLVKPMIRLASDPDDTYQPYTMTNRELTENANGLINHYPDYAWSKNKIIATSGANLNDITTPGLYKCQTGSIASTLVNCPVQSAFGLEVIIGNDVSAFIIQIIKYTVNANEVYMRTYSTNSWTSWYKFTGTVVS